jgi:methionine-rich copper-binding protein CopC
MRAVEVRPTAQSVMDGQRQEFYLRFDRPVNRNRSRLEVVQDSRVVRTLQPRLQAQPNVLFATTGGLPAGSYTLRWSARGQSAEETSEGSLDFTVGR